MSTPSAPEAPPAVRWIARTLEEAGHETWAVGGSVRDVFLGLESGDWDLATHARPQEVRRLFRRTAPIGIEHGTVGVLSRDGTLYEVTTFRKDVETDGRHAVVQFAETIDEDLARRDFTINALAWHPLRKELRDPFGGVGDAREGVLRTVGEPDERFREDYLRILRALRFAGRFGLEIEPATWEAMQRLVGNVRALSAERIRDELLKVLDADPTPARALELYAESGALAVLYPELEALREGADSWALTLATVEALAPGRPLLRLAALLRRVPGPDAAALLVRLRLSNQQTDETAYRAAAPPLPPPDADRATFRRWLSQVGVARLAAVARLDLAGARAERTLEAGAREERTLQEGARAERTSQAGDRVEQVVAAWRKARSVRAERPPLSVEDLALGGRDLIALGLEPGPRFRRILEDLLHWVLEDPSRNDRALLSERAVEVAGAAADG